MACCDTTSTPKWPQKLQIQRLFHAKKIVNYNLRFYRDRDRDRADKQKYSYASGVEKILKKQVLVLQDFWLHHPVQKIQLSKY